MNLRDKLIRRINNLVNVAEEKGLKVLWLFSKGNNVENI